MKFRAWGGVLCAALLQLACAQGTGPLPCADGDKKCAAAAIQRHTVRKLDSWSAASAKPVAERVGIASPQLVEYLNLDNIVNGYPERPRAATLDPAFLADVRQAIAELPPEVWRLFDKRLLGVYFVDKLGGTGYTDFVLNADNRPVAGYIVLDAGVLSLHTANAWATWKENTPFRPQTTFTLAARIETDQDNNRKNAIQYILLHELAHVLSIGSNAHPLWTVAPKDVADPQSYPFFQLSWRVDSPSNKYRSLFDERFPQRPDVRYYFGAKLVGEDMAPVYANLLQTNFSSLYAATSPGDDFAEAFASYVHVVLMRRPWQITITRNGEVLRVVRACWDEPRCADKRRLMEQVLQRPG